MLNLYKSNKIEVISELLAEDLKIFPPFITEKLEISVPNYFVGNWLREQITIKNKISALYELKTISSFTDSLLTNFFPEIDMGLWNFESIKWGIIDSLEELNTFKESLPLSNWINKYLDNQKTIDGDIYNLAKKITKNFIDYLIFRPEMIAEWNRYEINSKNLFKILDSDQFWQPILYKLLEKKISEKPSCLFMIEVIKNLRKIKKLEIKLPNQIYIISDNNLSKLHINFYSEISKFTKVNLYLLSAGDDLWNRINTIEGELEFNDNESKLNLNNTNIEKIFGKFGANFQKLIEENIYKEGINLKNNLIYIDPTSNFSDNKDIPLLNQIQKKIIDNNNIDFILNKRDDSILFNEHLNQNSQLEYLRNKIIELVNSSENIKYSDIAVVSPQINQIKPYLRYIFNNELINGEKIPYFFIDEDDHDSSEISKFLIDITEIANEKITLEKLDYILTKKVTQNIFDYQITDKYEIIYLLNQVGFHWGLDANERLGEEKNTLEWCLNRMTLGLIYDKEINLSTFNLKPFSSKNISLDLNKWIIILLDLIKYINLLRGSFSYLSWVEKIKSILKNIADSNANFNLEISEINRILDNNAIPLIPDDLILLDVFREILISCINKAKYRSKSRINRILVSDIENSRHIPQKVIFLIDMNSVYYPKLSINENINLLNNKYHLGDPSVFERDKYSFLELLIACKDKFIVNWVKNDKDNKKLDVSFPIMELISFFESLFNQGQRELIIKNSTLDKKAIDIDSSKIVKSNYSLVENKDWEEKKHDIKNYKLSELIYWFSTPQKYWLNKKNISPKGIFTYHPDDEYVSNLQKSQLITNVIKQLEIDNNNIIDDLKNLNINDHFVDNGIITPKNSIFTKQNEIKELLSSLSANLSQHNKIYRIYIKSNSNKEEYFIADDTVIELIHTKLSVRSLIEAWIKLIFISSLNKNIKKTKVIFRTDNQYKSQIIKSPGAIESNFILEEYINIFKNYSDKCLPLPPESSYRYVEAKIKSKNEKKAFSDRWIGNKTFSKGERDNIEMKICFGDKIEPDFFFGNSNFDKLSFRLFYPLVEALKNK